MTLAQLRAVLSIAVLNGHDTLVLGAFGCGYFRNPPGEVARAFADLLGPHSDFGGGVFRRVIFAIPKKYGLHSFDCFSDHFHVKSIEEVVAAGSWKADEDAPLSVSKGDNQYRSPRLGIATAVAVAAAVVVVASWLMRR